MADNTYQLIKQSAIIPNLCKALNAKFWSTDLNRLIAETERLKMSLPYDIDDSLIDEVNKKLNEWLKLYILLHKDVWSLMVFEKYIHYKNPNTALYVLAYNEVSQLYYIIRIKGNKISFDECMELNKDYFRDYNFMPKSVESLVKLHCSNNK